MEIKFLVLVVNFVFRFVFFGKIVFKINLLKIMLILIYFVSIVERIIMI